MLKIMWVCLHYEKDQMNGAHEHLRVVKKLHINQNSFHWLYKNPSFVSMIKSWKQQALLNLN